MTQIDSEWAQFCEQLHAVLAAEGRKIIASSASVLDRDEGLRMLLRQVRHSLERELEERDPTHPTFGPVFTDTYHTLADAPDYAAYDALISGQYTYRLRGRLGAADSITFTTMAPRPIAQDGASVAGDRKPWPGAGGADKPSAGRQTTGSVDLTDLKPDASGRFEVVLSVSRPDVGVWLPMTPQTNRLVVRNVYKSAYIEHCRRNPAQLWLTCEGVPLRPEPYTTDQLRSGLRSVLNGVERIPASRAPILERIRAAADGCFSNDDSFWKTSGANARTHFQEAYWSLDRHQALVIELDDVPRCSSWSLGLTNAWMESLDFRFFRINLNSSSAVYQADGSLHIVLSHTDPGHPNWLDVAGHQQGALVWRWNDASSTPPLPRVRVTDLRSVAAHESQ
jgi:Protein of unknown function (DUF1214)